MAIFGQSTGGGSTFPTTNDRAILSKFTAPSSGVVTQINQVWNSTSTGTDSFKGLIYAADGAGGIPGTLLGVGSIASVPAGGGDVASTGLSVSITGGVDYWLGSVIDGFSGVWECDAAVANLNRMESCTYASPAATWTQSGTGSATVKVYATYTSGPTITTQPVSVRGVAAGGTASFTVAATGGTLSYQWQDNSSGTFSNVGTNSASYTTGTLATGDSYGVKCIVTDSGGSTDTEVASVWVTTKYNPAWQGLYARAGRNFVLAQAIIPTSKAAGNIFDNALFDEATSTGITGTLAKTNANDTAVVLGTTTVLGTLAKTNVNDGRAISGTTTILGALARTNGNDTSSISGVVIPNGTISKTEVGDSMAASGSVGAAVSGTLTKTDVADTTVAAGTTTIVASVTKTDVADTASAAGTTTVRGDGVVTNSNDTMVASGSIGSAVFGTLATTNLSDSIAASGAPVPTATIAKTNTDDGMSASGTSTVLGVLIATNRNDTLAANGTSGTGGTAKILWNKLTVVVRNSL